MGFDPRLFDFINCRCVGVVGRVVDIDESPISQNYSVDNTRRCCDDVDIEFPHDPFKDNLEVE